MCLLIKLIMEELFYNFAFGTAAKSLYIGAAVLFNTKVYVVLHTYENVSYTIICNQCIRLDQLLQNQNKYAVLNTISYLLEY